MFRGSDFMRNRIALAAAALALAAPAQAKWHKAESPHFVVYADDSEQDVRKFAEILERFHSAMGLLTGRGDVIPSPSNRLVIFAVGSGGKVAQLIGDKSGKVAGFYRPGAGSSRAFVPDIQLTRGENDFSLTVLLHEYAHHFLISSGRFAMPRWVDEGAAEFFASAKFERDGSVGIGRPAFHRASELAYARDVTVEELLDHELYAKRHGKGYDAFYGRAWGLYHYLTIEDITNGARKDQLRNYAKAITGGKTPRESAAAAFGDLEQLEKDLDAYLKRQKLKYLPFDAQKIPPAMVRITALSQGEGEVMPLRIQSQRGVNRDEAIGLVAQVRARAARYPDDPGVLAALAEAEHDAGNDQAAIAAADKAIARDPSQVNAYVQKGYALFRMAGEASTEKQAAAFKEAMKPFEALNKIENDHPLPLIYYYRSFTEQGREPPAPARHALEWASQLAPFDQGLSFEVAMMQAREGSIALARSGLDAIAANPHGGPLAERARMLSGSIAKLSEGTRWQGNPVLELEAEPAKIDGSSGDKSEFSRPH